MGSGSPAIARDCFRLRRRGSFGRRKYLRTLDHRKKEKIRDSRVVGTFNLSSALAQAEEKPRVFICGSAIGYYGNRGDESLHEESAPGAGFLVEVCQDWEEATTPAVQADIRTAHIRTGVVLSPKGGALAAMLTPFKLGLGGRIGSGKQWMSWIDIRDMVGAIHHILKNDLIQGPVNLVAPRPVMNAEFAQTLASVLSRPAIFPLPEFALKLAFGQMGEEILLGSQKVEASKLISSGYPFRYRELRASLDSLLHGWGKVSIGSLASTSASFLPAASVGVRRVAQY